MARPIVVSHSELDAIRQCGHKAELAYRQRWVARSLSPAPAIGRLWHELLAIHYMALQADSTEKARMKAIENLLLDATINGGPDGGEQAGLVLWMYEGHLEMWGLDDEWEILEVEAQRLLRLPDPSGRGSRFYLRMRADLLIRERTLGGKIWLVDHKSGQNLPTEKELDLDDQFGIYTWGLRRDGLDIFGSLYSAARTQRNKDPKTQPIDERFSRTRLYRTPYELETVAREAYITVRTFYRYKDGEAPRSPDTLALGPHRCRFKCPYTEPCLMGRKSGPAQEQLYLKAAFDQLTEDEQLAARGYVEPMQP